MATDWPQAAIAAVAPIPRSLPFLSCSPFSQAGISTVVLDRQATGTNTSRAAAVHARTLEVLEPLDVTRRMLDAGHVVPTFVIRAHFVVGADGRHSTVREKSGIAIATLRGHRARTLRNTALKMASQIPLVPRTLATELAGLRYR